MKDYEKAVFNRMRDWLERKDMDELYAMDDEDVKREYYLRGGLVTDVISREV